MTIQAFPEDYGAAAGKPPPAPLAPGPIHPARQSTA